MFASTSLRLASAYTAAFALAVAVMGAVTIFATRAALSGQFDARIAAEATAVGVDYDEGGIDGLLSELRERKDNPGELSFGVQDRAGKPIAGALATLPIPAGWSVTHVERGGRRRELRVLRQDLAGGYRLVVGDDTAAIEGIERSVALLFGVAFVCVVVVGAAGGFAFSRAMHRRLGAISGTAEAIIDGDLGRRIPITPGEDDLSRLAQTINRMLDRISSLMESLRQVSSDVAHDLRTPLARHRQRLELSLLKSQGGAQREEIEGALRDVDAILATFAALLRIAEVEAGARRSAFRRLDLAELTRELVADYGPAAEDAGRTLTLQAPGTEPIDGDRALLAQMIINLVENAMTHTGPGAPIDLALSRTADGVVLTVRDHGPGVPPAERERVFDRFYRLERSRSTPGSGLGLALVAAVARLHRGAVSMEDAHPGLRVEVSLPRPAA